MQLSRRKLKNFAIGALVLQFAALARSIVSIGMTCYQLVSPLIPGSIADQDNEPFRYTAFLSGAGLILSALLWRRGKLPGVLCTTGLILMLRWIIMCRYGY